MSERLQFYFDVQCPFAYMASVDVLRAMRNNGTPVDIRPCLLGGIYRLTSAPQGTNSASSVMCQQRKRIEAADLLRQLYRRGITNFSWPQRHPMRSVEAQRLICAARNNVDRALLMEAFYSLYWVENKDITDMSLLTNVMERTLGYRSEITEAAKQTLTANTDELASHGGFGVPSFYVPSTQEFYWGADRSDLAFGRPMRRLQPHWDGVKRKLTFYFDFASPWAFLGSLAVLQLDPQKLEIEYVPVLLGALFKNIGTPNVPMLALSEHKRNYGSTDMKRWAQFRGTALNWPDVFPIRTVSPLRAAIVDPSLIPLLYEAAWVLNRNIGDKDVLTQLVSPDVMARISDAEIKEQLRENTSRAVRSGVCGVPSFQVDNGPVVWGQDRMNVVEDLLSGWEDMTGPTTQRARL